MDALSDLDISVRKAQSGDLVAFELVIKATARQLFAYLALYVVDNGLIDDLAQESFLYAYEHLAEYTPGTNFIAWLKTIAKFRALSHLRAAERKRSAHQRYVDAVHARLGAASEAFDSEGVPSDLLERLRACVSALGDFAQRLVQMRYYESRPVEDIATELSRTTGSINVAIFRIRSQLAACLGHPTGTDAP